MKKRMFVPLLIFIACLSHFLIPDAAFGQAAQVFKDYKETFRRQDVYDYFPDILETFTTPYNQIRLFPRSIVKFADDPKYILRYYSDTHDSILTLLAITSPEGQRFQALFRDSNFHDVLQRPTEINKLVREIRGIPSHQLIPTGQVCEVPTPKPTTLKIVSGDNQSGEVGKPLAELFVVSVLDQEGKPLQKTVVTFTVTPDNGQLSPMRQMTDVSGNARTTLTLGSNPGTYLVKASVAAVDSLNGVELTQTFTATATGDEDREPRELKIVSGHLQSGEVGKPLAEPFVVGVLDQEGKPLEGIAVTFTVTEGEGGQLSTTNSQMTDVYGQARTTLTLGSDADSYSVMARAAGITGTQTFTAIAAGDQLLLPPMYWIEGNTIYYRPTGGEKEIFKNLQDETLTGGLAVDTEGRKVYWTEQTSDTTGRIRSITFDKSRVEKVAELKVEDGVPYGITVGTDKKEKHWIYWTTSQGKIQRINIDGLGLVENLIDGLVDPKHIAFDKQEAFEKQERNPKLYWTEPGLIRFTYPNGTGGKPVFKKELDALGSIAVANGVVYWTEETNGLGKVRSMQHQGSGAKLLAVTESIPAGIAVDTDDGRVYWTTADGEIQSVPLTGAIQTVVMRGTGAATGIALGGTATTADALAAPSLSPVVSVENTLLANYPNPFNPETWIPYELAASADVSVSIYSVNGHLVRHLELGHQSAGMYKSRSRAAYWDGRNEFGERVASGLYFYTLTAGDFTATRKMLIRK